MTPHPSRSASHLLPQGEKGFSRRLLLGLPLALAACERFAEAQTPARAVPGLKAIAPFPIGTCIKSNQIDDPAWVDLAARHVSQLTPEWEMKMEYIVQPDGSFRFDAPDRIAAFDAYIATVAGRYRGKVVSWDVVNEPITDAGDALRDCHWSRALGQDGYIIRAFERARAADPEAVLFLNDYNLENTPAKGATFLKLVERLMKAGAPIGGIGSQSHLDIEIPAGQVRDFIRDAGSLGLPIHISELDASLRSDRRLDLRSRDQRLSQQTGRVGELAEAFMALPASQRFAFTVWGLRDTDSWLRQGERDDGQDQPLPFDAGGRPNPMFDAMAGAFTAQT